MPRSPPPRRLKLHDMRHGDREPTPESQSPSSYESSGEDSSSDSNDEKKKNPKAKNGEPRWKFPTKASQRNPFPHGLPHANHYGAIRPRPLNEEDAIKLDPAPETPNWRPVNSGWFTMNYQGPIVVDSDADADDEGDEKKAKDEVKKEKKQGKKRTRSG